MNEAPEFWTADKPPPQQFPEPSLYSARLFVDIMDYDRGARPPDVSALRREGFDWRWHMREWARRERARAIIEGRRPWPRDLLHYKLRCEVRYYHRGVGTLPPWRDPENWTDPTRDPEEDGPALRLERPSLDSLKRRGVLTRRRR